jgi:hypothetical protein
VTAELRHLYTHAVRGRLEAYRHWLMPVHESVPAVSVGSAV